MTVTDITRSLSKSTTEHAFNGIVPDSIHEARVRRIKHPELLSTDPLDAGNTIHGLLSRMADNDPLTPVESAHFPWVSSLRRLVWGLGADQMDIDVALSAHGHVPHGTCDLLVYGGPKPRGILEVKVIAKGAKSSPRARDLVQLAAYARLCAGRGSFDDLWAGLAYLELETRMVRLMVYNNARDIIVPALPFLRAA